MKRNLVLLHGWGMRAAIWDGMRERLTSHDVCAPDLPGYGATVAPDAYTLDAAVEALACEAAAEVDVVGWSLGGTIAMHWALTRPAQVRRLILIAATPCFVVQEDWSSGVSAATLRIFTTQLKRDPDALMRRFCALQAAGEPNAEALAERLYSERAEAESTTLLSSLALLGESDLRGRMKGLAQRTLILHGAQDAVTPVAAAHWMADTLPRADLRVYQTGGHALPFSHAQDCATHILDFVNE